METDRFCSVDIENMWNKFFRRVRLIDGVSVSDLASGPGKQVRLSSIELKDLEVRWFVLRNGEELLIKELDNVRSWEAPSGLKGAIRVRLRYITPEVRKPAGGYLDSFDFTL
jgi:hypothetical protein